MSAASVESEPLAFRHRTSTRLAAAFATVLVLFAAALAVTLVALSRIDGAEAEVAGLDHAKHAGHMAAAQVREQYIHQAHTIISWDTSHLEHYERAVAAALASADHLMAVARWPEEQRLAVEIGRLARDNDRQFRDQVVPSIVAGDRDQIHELHERIEVVVSRVVALNEQLNALLERRGADAGARAAQLSRRARTATIACFALAIALAALVGLWLTRSIVRPISALRTGARKVGTGDLEARIQVPGKSEIADLGKAFNQMTVDLARRQAELVRSQRLAAIGHVAAGVAHELNNPLGVIIGYTALLRRDGALTASDELRIIDDEARQCQRIVQGLLDLARPQRRDPVPVDLAELARDAVSRLDELGKLAGISVETPPAGSGAVAHGDESKLRQVVSNIITNAVEATPGGTIRIEAVSGDGQARLVVTDTGKGIPAEIMPRIFDPFFTTKASGTGLGLAIAQAIVDAHAGRLEIQSSPEHGTRVALTLPRSPS